MIFKAHIIFIKILVHLAFLDSGEPEFYKYASISPLIITSSFCIFNDSTCLIKENCRGNHQRERLGFLGSSKPGYRASLFQFQLWLGQMSQLHCGFPREQLALRFCDCGCSKGKRHAVWSPSNPNSVSVCICFLDFFLPISLGDIPHHGLRQRETEVL